MARARVVTVAVVMWSFALAAPAIARPDPAGPPRNPHTTTTTAPPPVAAPAPAPAPAAPASSPTRASPAPATTRSTLARGRSTGADATPPAAPATTDPAPVGDAGPPLTTTTEPPPAEQLFGLIRRASPPERVGFPAALLVVIAAFLFVQHRVDRRDPKLQHVAANDSLPFASGRR